MSYKNYIFDLYGTLIDIHTDERSKGFFKRYARWLRGQGFPFWWKEFRQMYTRTEQEYRQKAADEGRYANPEIEIDSVFREVFAQKGFMLSGEEITSLCESFRNISIIHLRLFPDTKKCLEGLKKADRKIYLLSNAQRSFTWQELVNTGIEPYFDGILISSDEGCMKPDPAFYNICCERFGLEKPQSIMIGNELGSDIAGAEAAGIDSFYINRDRTFHEDSVRGCKYVSPKGSLMEVLLQTGIME